MITIDTMQGLGDSIWQRPILKAMAFSGERFKIITPWPEVYDDLGVEFCHPETRLRTQRKNIFRVPRYWSKPEGLVKRMWYHERDRIHGGMTIFRSLELHCEREWGFRPRKEYDFDLPPNLATPFKWLENYVVIRPVTSRTEWNAGSRNCDPKYISQCNDILRADGYTTVGIADIDGIVENFVGEPPDCDVKFYRGELDAQQILGLVANAKACVSPGGFMVPMATYARVPIFYIIGGFGGMDTPERMFDHRVPLDKLGVGMPDNLCPCTSTSCRKCDKTISNLLPQFQQWRKQVGL